MKQITLNNQTFRAKKMNAIEMLSLRSQIDFDDYQKTMKLYETFLNNMEVEFNGQWLPVRKEAHNGQVNYYPAGIEDDVNAIDQLIQFFMKEVMMPVFTNSNASK